MNLQNIITKKRLIDVNLFSDQRVSYTGICLKANRHIWIFVNYDYKKKYFNGFTIIKNNIVETFTLWKKKAIVLKQNNLTEFANLLPSTSLNTFYSTLKWAKKFQLVAVFTETNTRSYFVGEILILNFQTVTLRLINIEGKWSRKKIIELKDIYFISFYTDYENNLIKKLKPPSPSRLP